MMADRDCGAIPVVRDMKSMRPVGIVTDRDIVVRALAKGQDLAALRAGDCMTANPLVVRPDTSTDECAWQMARHRIRRAIVIDEQCRCIGIIAQADLARSAPSHITSELVREISQPSTGTIAP
jgi:CBS domain-containing protein